MPSASSRILQCHPLWCENLSNHNTSFAVLRGNQHTLEIMTSHVRMEVLSFTKHQTTSNFAGIQTHLLRTLMILVDTQRLLCWTAVFLVLKGERHVFQRLRIQLSSPLGVAGGNGRLDLLHRRDPFCDGLIIIRE